MAQREEGWPLGLQPLNVRYNGSISFNTLITSSSSDSSSDLDTESTASFFHDKSITLGSLIGITSILEFSRRSTRRRRTIVETTKIRDHNKIKSSNNSNKSRTWLFSLCSKLSTDAVVNINNNINSAPPSLGHFLEAERKASASAADNNNNSYGLDDFNQLSDDHSNVKSNSLFIDGQIVPPHPPHDVEEEEEEESRKGLFEQNGTQNGHHGSPMIFSCLCGNLVH